MKTKQAKPIRRSMLDVGRWMFDVLPFPPSFLVLLLPLLLLLLPVAVQAGDYTYTINDGTITITGYTGASGEVNIPSTINGLPVVGIRAGAFDTWRRYLTSVTIPDSVISIEEGAFNGCTNLASVTIGNGVTKIDSITFSGCIRLTNITIPDSVTRIELGAFYNCISLAMVTIGNGVTSIGNEAFWGCSSLTSVTIPSSVSGIGHSAFALCASLTSVTIGNGVTNIESGAFSGCSSLPNITIPNSVTSIGAGVFGGCASLTSITIPDSVASIGYNAFYGCASLTNVTIGNSVTHIGGDAFSICRILTAITVDPFNPSYISLDGVLFNKSQTALIRYPEGKAGSQYTIPDSVASIGYHAFYGGASLTSVTIGNSVTNIGDWAFESCISLISVCFKGNAPTISGSGALFGGDANATVYYLPGTKGWDTTFGGRPTALWSLPYPLILNNGPSFGMQTNGFGFIISWATNLPVVVEVCTDLASPDWSALQTNTLTSGSSYFSDPQWTNYPSRFYRLRAP